MHSNDDESPISYFCEGCFSNSELKRIVRERGSLSKNCPICATENAYRLETKDAGFRNTIRALIRVHYSEYEYNGHLDGESLSTLLAQKNEIFDLSQSANLEEFEAAFFDIEDEWYPITDEEVSLGGGYWDGSILFSLSKYQHQKVYRLSENALNRNSYELLEEATSIFESIADLVREEITPSSTWFRARLGFKEKYRSSTGSFRQYYAYAPYTHEEVGAPPPHIASEGRLNRYRTSVLYLATDELTAISEIRPQPGHIVSVGEFNPKRSITVANLAAPNVESQAKDKLLERLHLAISLGVFANLPVTPETRHWYMATQLIGDAARAAGFEGVMFRSTVSSGTNLVVFDPSLFNQASRVKAVEVKALSYSVAPLLDVSSIDLQDYEKDEDEFLFNEILTRKNV